MGDAAHLLHLRPFEWRLLTVEEADALLDWLDDYQKAMEEAEAKAKRS